jgi:prepilin-type N-terminal cleavage/methylation domain-containing protein
MRRGFTILEVLVALTIGVVVLGSAVSLVVVAGRHSDAARRRAHLARTASFLDHNLSRDLRHAGLGMPTGPFHSVFASGEGRFHAPILVGTVTAVGLVGDLPRPDADGAPFGALATIPGSDGTSPPARFWWFNDNNGLCIPSLTPSATGTRCSLAETSRLFPGLGGCDAPGRGGDLTCPWGRRNLLPDEYFVVVAGDGSWALARMPGPGSLGASLVVGPSGRHLLFASNSTSADWDPLLWRNANPQVDPPAAQRGQGFVSSLDRVFYFQQGQTLQRLQCMGVPDPENPGFPSADITDMPPLDALRYTPPGGRPRTSCVGPELVADLVQHVEFVFLDVLGNELPRPLTAEGKRAVRGVTWHIEFADLRARGIPVRETLEGAVALRNLP